jgi:hypothetical protein
MFGNGLVESGECEFDEPFGYSEMAGTTCLSGEVD